MYVFCFFREFAPALHFAISSDLLHWGELNRQEPILESQVGAKYWRDPFIIGSESGTFHLLCTDGWESPNIIHASSTNLIDWSEQQVIPVMKDFPLAKNAWAPEACFDQQRQEFRIFWSSTVPTAFPSHKDKQKGYLNHRIYSCTTKDFITFSKTELYFDPGFNCIDASINYSKGQYLMAFKDERGENGYFLDELARKHVLTATTSDLNGPWEIRKEPISKTSYSPTQSNDKITWTEGPCVFRNTQKDEWWVFFEYFRAHQYGLVKSTNGNSWEDMDKQLYFPPGAKHGTIFEVTNPEVIRGLRALHLPFDDDD